VGHQLQVKTVVLLVLIARPEGKDFLYCVCVCILDSDYKVFSMITIKTYSSFYFQNILFALLFAEISSVLHHLEPRQVHQY
jgi:hypothetical protein